MTFKQTLKHWYQNVLITGLLLTGSLLLVPGRAVASTYGSGAYGSCPYGQSCPASSSSGSGTSSTPPTTTPASQVLLNDFAEFATAGGKTLDLSAGQAVYFNITVNGQTENHSITVKQVGDGFVILTFAPNGFDTTISTGQTGLYDVNDDGQNDIKITLNSITNGVASLTFSSVLGTSTTQTPGTNTTAPATSAASKGRAWLWITLSILAILVALGIFFILWRRRRKDRDQTMWPPNPPTQPSPPPTPPTTFTPPNSPLPPTV